MADIDESGNIDELEFRTFVRCLEKDRKKNPDLNLKDACKALERDNSQAIQVQQLRLLLTSCGDERLSNQGKIA